MFEERLLLRCVDPDDVQVAVIHTLLVFVSVACASLHTPPGLWRVTGRARRTGAVVHAVGRRRPQHGHFHLPPLIHISARGGPCRVTEIKEAFENILSYQWIYASGGDTKEQEI